MLSKVYVLSTKLFTVEELFSEKEIHPPASSSFFNLLAVIPIFFFFYCLLDGRLCKYFLREHVRARFFNPCLNFCFLEIKVDILEHNIVMENRYPLFQTSELMQLLCLPTTKSSWTTVCSSFQQKYLLFLCESRRKIVRVFRRLIKQLFRWFRGRYRGTNLLH